MNQTLLLEVAHGIAAAGLDLTYSEYRGVCTGGDLAALKDYVREELCPDDPVDDRPLTGERLVSFVAKMLLDAMAAQHEVDVRRGQDAHADQQLFP